LVNSTTVPLTSDTYVLGIKTVGNLTDQLVWVNMTGDYCNASTIWDGMMCITPNTTTPDRPTNVTVPEGSAYVFTVSLQPTPFVKELQISYSQNVSMCLRFESAVGNCYQNIPGNPNMVKVPVPRIGKYIGIVTQSSMRSKLVDYTFSLTVTTPLCNDTNGGFYCNLTASSLTSTSYVSAPLQQNDWVYYQVTVANNATSYFWITVASDKPDSTYVYVSQSQFPTPENADLYGCNQQLCRYTVINNQNSSFSQNVPTTYYIGITCNETINYGIWSGTLCAPGCTNNGVCQAGGFCACSADYVGFDCGSSSNTGLQAQYIVLIIIASLVVASAIIGFIAWAYMQKKRRGDYSPVASERA